MAAPMKLTRFTLNILKNHVKYSSVRTFMPHNRPKAYGGWDAILPENRKRVRDEIHDNKQSFAEILDKKEKQEKLENPERSPVNIGVDYKPSRTRLKEMIRTSPNSESLEQAARHRKLQIPLDEMRECWHVEFEPIHTKRLAEHYGIYKDLFENAFFYPVVDLQVSFNYDAELVTPVYRGNILTPEDASSEPIIEYEAEDDTLWTLILTNPDGNLTDNNSEYLHWMIGNIPGADVSRGDLLCNYLQPFPPRGTGFHRHVFLLFKQGQKIDFTSVKRPQNCTCLKQRTFSTSEFYEMYENDLTPMGLRFFQAQYDDTVRHVYHNLLDMREPAFEYCHPPPYHPPQVMYPRKQPFDRYYDRYRDKKEIAEEVMKMKLGMISPFKPWKQPRKYPSAHVDPSRPSWLRARDDLLHRRMEQFQDLPKEET